MIDLLAGLFAGASLVAFVWCCWDFLTARDGDTPFLRDRDERLRELLRQCPVRMRHTLIDGANITSERGR